ncbi:uncharacterized protein LOC121688449 [Alosa sapidissima]|uniref:uncharacterized protein LOC121688449 n=1 Tax=Alosa sapidissima TaxID=34773 RepID=UPI001C09A4DB|nr:uncharacterized protein LOC121688449 [Alosa sapidissima]
MKKSKKGEVHYCPDPPEGLSAEDMEEKQRMMEVEVLKKDSDHQQIDELMSATFSKRRKEIVGDQPLIGDVIARWPAMFCERRVRAEFKRVVSTDLLESFLDGLDELAPRLLELYEAATKSGKKPTLKAILDCLKKDDTYERRRTAALPGLPHYLPEEPSDIIRMCDAPGETGSSHEGDATWPTGNLAMKVTTRIPFHVKSSMWQLWLRRLLCFTTSRMCHPALPCFWGSSTALTLSIHEP